MSEHYTQTDCSTCLIGNAMRDCPLCIFYQGQPMKLSSQPEPDVANVDDDLAAIMAMLRGAMPLVGCQCENGIVYLWHTYPATPEEPAETVGRVRCVECATDYELGYEPEGMQLEWKED